MFWKVQINPEITNDELVKKAYTKMLSLMKQTESPSLEVSILEEAFENVGRGQRVIPCLKAIRKICLLKEKVNQEMLDEVIEKGLIANVFSSLKKFKAEIRAAASKQGVVLNEGNVNQCHNDKITDFENQIIKRLKFIDFGKWTVTEVLLNHKKTKEDVIKVINTIWEELVENSLIETEANYFNKWFVQFNSKEAEKIVRSA
jgi:hypothetical protein